jgi:hypothetical protein
MFERSLVVINNISYLNIINFDKNYANKNKIESIFNYSSDYVKIISNDLESVRTLYQKAKKLETIGRIESIINYLPDSENSEKQFRYLRKIRREMQGLDLIKYISDHDVSMYQNQMQRLEGNIIDFQDSDTSKGLIYNKTVRLVGEVNDNLNKGILTNYVSNLNLNFSKLQLTYLHQKFSQYLKSSIITLSSSEILNFDNLPIQIKERFVDKKSNRFVTKIYPKKNLYSDEIFYKKFNYEINSLNEEEHYPGYAIDTARILKRENRILLFMLAAFISLVFIHFKNIVKVLNVILLITVIFIWILGTYDILSISFNLIYIIIIPIILLIIITYFIQIFNKYRNQSNYLNYYIDIFQPMLVSLILTILCFGSFYYTVYEVFVLISQTLCISMTVSYLIIFLILPCFFKLEFQYNNSNI